MPKKRVHKKTIDNPFGLTYKQDLVIKDVVAKVSRGKSMDIRGSVEKFYNPKNRRSADQVVVYNMKHGNFREALVSSLIEKKILGADSITEDKLIEGLDAEDREGNANYDTRLKYIQEINKIGGVYAAEKRQVLNLNMDMTEEELDNHIKELQDQLGG
jgi:hypothetical protein